MPITDRAATDVAEEVLHESEFTRVARIRPFPGDSRSVICKEPRGPGAAQRLRHELGILERLAGVDGVPQLIREPHRAGSILLEDTAAAALTDLPPFAGPALAEFALQIARIVGGVHRNGVVHKDINPTNVVVSQPRGPMLIDFHLATTFAEDRPGFTPPAEIAGTLEYVAPEQTGRTGRRVDQRSDLYALGATLYELATGRPPFGHGDPFQLIHDHLARVPTPPQAVAGVGPGMSDIIMRLLEKDPDRRYQSADGLAHDLAVLAERERDGDGRTFALGEHDFPLRLSAPSRLVGRELEIRSLQAVFARVNEGGRGVLIGGPPGVGKSALIDELRALVTAAGGWMVKGKFDQYRRDVPADGLWQALRALGRLLLAEPEERLHQQRECLRTGMGPNAGLVAALLPELARVLDLGPAELTGTAEGAPGPIERFTDVYDRRLQQAGADLIRSIVAMGRPLVIVLDDLQWAGLTPMGLVDALVTHAAQTPGLLIVGAYREVDVGVAHPLRAMLARWDRLEPPPVRMLLRNLPPADLATFLHEMLRLPPDAAGELAQAVGERTRGNPYDTVEFINALRRDGALVQRDGGWSWDARTLRRYLGYGDVVALLAARVDALPSPSAQLLELMACLGGDVELSLLEAATGESAAALEANLAAPLEDGLLTLGQDSDLSVRFRHDRVRQAAYGRISPHRRQQLQLDIARRLAGAGGDRFTTMAAEQYLAAAEAITDPAEELRAAALFRQAASAVRPVNAAGAERLLATAIRLLDRDSCPDDPDLRFVLLVKRHQVLYDLARHDDIDEVYRQIEDAGRDPVELAGPVYVQVNSLCDRGRENEGVALGVDLIRRLGLDAPDGEIGLPTAEQWDALYAWVDGAGVDEERDRPPVQDPRVLAIARVLGGLSTPAFFAAPRVLAWMVLASQRLWAEYGPCVSLAAGMSFVPAVTIGLRRDYRTAYLASRHALAISEARRYEPATSYVRSCFALFASHWFEPLENSIAEAQRAREGLLRARHMQGACYSYNATLSSRLECAPSIDDLDEEVEAALELAVATDSTHSQASFVIYRQVLRALRGQTSAPGSFDDDDLDFDEARQLAGPGGHPLTASIHHVNRAIVAAIFGDWAAVAEHCAAAMPTVRVQGHYRSAVAHTLYALSLAQRIRAARAADDGADTDEMLAELDRSRDWLAERAADAHDNFDHLLRVVEAERAWILGDRLAAVSAFDTALSELEGGQRPWHQGLITERAAAYQREHGLEHLGRSLLGDARRIYSGWGATAKVEQLDGLHPFLRRRSGREPRPTTTSRVSADAIDLMAVLETSQALSSERSLDRLRTRVVETLSGLTGATSVQVLVWDDEARSWLLPADTGALTLDEAAAHGLLPLTAFRYAERTREPLLVDDAIHDHRFSRDRYLAGLAHCSLLVVPILNQGTPLAMLLLENRLSRAAFSADRLDAVKLIAGQLGVSFENARVYESLGRMVDERTAELAAANDRLEVLTRTDDLTGLANRRRMGEVLDAELRLSQHTGTSTGVMMIDIDHFKLYNDRYGHVAGDQCLRRVAVALQQSVRTADIIARYGGEEFAIVLPRTGLPEVFEIAERARAAVAGLAEPHDWSPRGQVTVSIGIASETATARTTSEVLFEAADAQLYDAKRRGRNQVRGLLP